MNTIKAASGIRLPLLCGILGIYLLAGTAPARAVTYVNHTPLSFGWADASGTVDHYNVYVSVDGQPFELLEHAGGCTCSLDAEDGRSYVVQVEAEDDLGRVGPMSDPSDQIVVFLNGSAGDTDGDGMPDDWEASEGLNPFDPSDADGDPDGDGSTNLDEFMDGTDPADPDSDGDGTPDGEDDYPLDPLNGNTRPVADAGGDQELDPTVVMLDGSGSYDPDGDPLSYAWTQEDGPEVSLSDEHAESPTFLGTESGTYAFELIVHDGSLASLPAEVAVTIRNVPPSADAGEDVEVLVGTVAVLDGSGSADSNRDPIRYAWTQMQGAPVLIDGADNQTATVVPEQVGNYVFQLVTFDGELYSTPDDVQVIVNAPANNVPNADAGENQTVTVGDTVLLNGSGSSDPDGDSLLYTWSQTGGPETVALDGAVAVQATFEAPEAGIYAFQLVVHDGQVASAPDIVTVTAESPANQAPVAAIESVDPVEEGEWIALDGSGSYDPDHDALSYAWSQTGGPQVMLEDGDLPVAGCFAVAEGTLTFQLVVHDGEASSTPATVLVQVVPGEDPPAVDPPEVDPPAPPVQAQSDDGGSGCTVSMAASSRKNINASDLGYLLTLFLPAIGALLYQKRRFRRRKG